MTVARIRIRKAPDGWTVARPRRIGFGPGTVTVYATGAEALASIKEQSHAGGGSGQIAFGAYRMKGVLPYGYAR